MNAIDNLMTEHRLIERTLTALGAFADVVQRSEAEDKEELARFVRFIREFADAYHHGKEEKILFAAMVQAGFPREAGPIAVMLAEHDRGRELTRELAELAGAASPWSAADRERLAGAAHGYGDLLRAHIYKEDAVLYPMAEQRLPPQLLARVDAECERYDVARAGSGEHGRLVELGEALVAAHAPLGRDEPRRRVGC